jgi:hypothetical protein
MFHKYDLGGIANIVYATDFQDPWCGTANAGFPLATKLAGIFTFCG